MKICALERHLDPPLTHIILHIPLERGGNNDERGKNMVEEDN